MTNTKIDPRVTKRKVVCTSVAAGPGGMLATYEKVDYVPEEILEERVAQEKLAWQNVEVVDGYDAGPGGYDGATFIPEGSDHPNAGQLIPATPGSEVAALLAKNLEG